MLASFSIMLPHDAIFKQIIFLFISYGDDVRFSNGANGNIEKVGWFESMIPKSDELVVGIPSTQVG